MHQTAFRLLLMHQWSTYFRTYVVYWSGAINLCEGLGIEFKLILTPTLALTLLLT